jgi:predicted DNA-binding helix-hairpin-helix protein
MPAWFRHCRINELFLSKTVTRFKEFTMPRMIVKKKSIKNRVKLRLKGSVNTKVKRGSHSYRQLKAGIYANNLPQNRRVKKPLPPLEEAERVRLDLESVEKWLRRHRVTKLPPGIAIHAQSAGFSRKGPKQGVVRL